jgi:hypothetical protein
MSQQIPDINVQAKATQTQGTSKNLRAKTILSHKRSGGWTPLGICQRKIIWLKPAKNMATNKNEWSKNFCIITRRLAAFFGFQGGYPKFQFR